LKVFIYFVQKTRCAEPRLIRADEQCQIFGHMAGFNRIDTDFFQALGEFFQFSIVVQFSAMEEAPGPRKDGCDGVGGCFFAFLMGAQLVFGLLFGFVGLLVAVPLAASIGVLIRFALKKYLASPLYLGTQPKRSPVKRKPAANK